MDAMMFLDALSARQKKISSQMPARKRRQQLTLATVKSAKGHEWSHVIVPYIQVGEFPRTSNLQEEKRFLYVAMTRARDHLVLMLPQRFYVHGQNALGDRHVYASRSRFLPEGICNRFDISTLPAPGPAGPGSRHAGQLSLSESPSSR